MDMIEFDSNHPFLAKVRKHFVETNKSYPLETDEERSIAKIFVKRDFLYYAGSYDAVSPLDARYRS